MNKFILFLFTFILSFAVQAQDITATEDETSEQVITVTTDDFLDMPKTSDAVMATMKILELPGLNVDKYRAVNLVGWTRYVEYGNDKISQIVVTGVEKDGVTIPLNDADHTGQNDVDDNLWEPGEEQLINSNLADLITAINTLTEEGDETATDEATEKSVVEGGNQNTGAGTGNEQASAYQSPDAIEAKADPVIRVSSTTDGCDVRIDFAQGVAIQQSKSITYEDGAIKSETECSDTLDRFSLERSYSVCDDLIDLEAMTATSQYVYYYVDNGASRNDVSDCSVDSEEVFAIEENASSCIVRLDFANKTVIPQVRLTYENRNNIETQVRGCDDSEATMETALIENFAGCSIVHDYARNESIQYSSYSYEQDGIYYQALPCTDTDITYQHETVYTDSFGEYICAPVVNMQTQKVTLQSRKQISVDGLNQFITECEPDTTSINVASTHDGCTDLSLWKHDIEAQVSYGQHRYYYNKEDGSRYYVTDCQSNADLYEHKIEIVGYQNHDDKLASYQLSSVWIETDFGNYTIAQSAVLSGSQLMPYTFIEVKDSWNGETEYADNSCDALRLTNKVEVYDRLDGSQFEKIIGEGTPIGPVDTCTSVAQLPVWEWTGSQTAGGVNYSKGGSYNSRDIYSYIYFNNLRGEYKGKRVLTRDDGNEVIQFSSNKWIPSDSITSCDSADILIMAGNSYIRPNTNRYYPFNKSQKQEFGASNGLWVTSLPINITFKNINGCPTTYTGQDVYSWNQAEGW